MKRIRYLQKHSYYRKGSLYGDAMQTRSKKSVSLAEDNFALISQGEMNVISRYILDYKKKETGGQLFGYWTREGNPVILYVLGPGPSAGHHSAYFMQDIEYLRTRAEKLSTLYGLEHMGEWHSHHQLGLSFPSGHDARNISTNMKRLGYQRFLLCIGTCTDNTSSIKAFLFSSSTQDYCEVPWKIKQIESPFRKIIEDISGSFFFDPHTKSPQMSPIIEMGKRGEKITFSAQYWLKEKGNGAKLQEIISFLESTSSNSVCVPTIDGYNEVHLVLTVGAISVEDIHFPQGFPIESPKINTTNGFVLPELATWFFNGDIVDSFKKYYQQTIKNK